MIKLNIECAFPKETDIRQSNIVPRLENQPSGSKNSQNDTRLSGISEELRELKRISEQVKDINDDILKAQEALNVQLGENSKGLIQMTLNTKSFFKIIEQIAYDNNKIREYFEALKLDENQYPVEKSAQENEEFPEEAKQIKHEDNKIVERQILKEVEIERKAKEVCEKGTQSDNELASSNILGNLNMDKKESVKYNETELQRGMIVKCSYCEESHLKTNVENQVREESESSFDKANEENKCGKSYLRSRETNNSNTWPLNKNSQYDLKTAVESTAIPTNTIKYLEENKERNQQREAVKRSDSFEKCIKSTQAPEDALEQITDCQDNILEKEVIQTPLEDKQSQGVTSDRTKCKVCKSSSCNLSKPLGGRYSSDTSFKFNHCGKLGTNSLGVGGSRRPLTNKTSPHSLSRSRVGSNALPFTKTAQSRAALNVANDLCKRHVKNCTVHGCVPPPRSSERNQGKLLCHGGQFSSNEHAKVTKGLSCHNLQPDMKTEDEEVIKSKLVDTHPQRNEMCKSDDKSSCETKSGQEGTLLLEKTVQCSSKEHRESDSVNNDLDSNKEGMKNGKFSNGVFSTSKRKVLALAQEAKRSKEYKFMWFRGGKVFMKKEENSPIVTISNLSDINNL